MLVSGRNWPVNKDSSVSIRGNRSDVSWSVLAPFMPLVLEADRGNTASFHTSRASNGRRTVSSCEEVIRSIHCDRKSSNDGSCWR